MANKSDIAKVLGMMSAAFPNFKMQEKTPDVYLALLADMPDDLLFASVAKCCAEAGRAFAPSAGEIRGAAGELYARISGLPTSYQAWQEVQEQILRNGGDYGKPIWSHPLVEKAVQAIGWRTLRMSEDQTQDRARFIQAYEQLSKRAEEDLIMLPDVRKYIEAHGGKFLPAGEKIQALAGKLKA